MDKRTGLVSSTKLNKIVYWISTIWLAPGMVSSGIVQLMKLEEETEMIRHLGYPVYFLTIISVWKMLGVVAVLIPGFPLLKEWAYAGFFFMMSGAVFSHIVSGDEAKDLFGPLLLLTLTVILWYFRPGDRKIILVNQ